MVVVVAIAVVVEEVARGRHGRRKWGDGGTSPRNYVISVFFFLGIHISIFPFSDIFKMKWPKSVDKLNFGGRWACVWVPMNPSPQNKTSWPLEGGDVGEGVGGRGEG